MEKLRWEYYIDITMYRYRIGHLYRFEHSVRLASLDRDGIQSNLPAARLVIWGCGGARCSVLGNELYSPTATWCACEDTTEAAQRAARTGCTAAVLSAPQRVRARVLVLPGLSGPSGKRRGPVPATCRSTSTPAAAGNRTEHLLSSSKTTKLHFKNKRVVTILLKSVVRTALLKSIAVSQRSIGTGPDPRLRFCVSSVLLQTPVENIERTAAETGKIV